MPQLRQANRSLKVRRSTDALRELTGSLCPLDAADVLAVRATLRLAGASLGENVHLDDATGQGSGGLDRLREPSPQVALHHQAVDDHRDVVVELLVELDLLVQPPDLVVDPDAAVALQPELLEELLELALAAPDHRRHHHEPRPLVEGHDPVGDLLDRLPLDRLPALGAVGLADPRPEQAQIVVDLGDGADRRARVARGRLLVDRDRRRETVDRVDVRLLHQAEELAGVGGQRLDVAALTLGVDRVEGKARLAGPGEAGHDDQGVARQLEVDVLEVVLTRPADDYALGWSHYVDDRSRTDVPRSGTLRWRRPNQVAPKVTSPPASADRQPRVGAGLRHGHTRNRIADRGAADDRRQDPARGLRGGADGRQASRAADR